MVDAKNYETASTVVEVMQKKLRPLFFRTRCTYINLLSLLVRYRVAQTPHWYTHYY